MLRKRRLSKNVRHELKNIILLLKKYEFIFGWIIALSLLAIFIVMIIGKTLYSEHDDLSIMEKLEHPVALIYMAIVSAFIQFWLGRSYYANGYNEVFKWRNWGMNTLISISTLVAWWYSFILMWLKIALPYNHQIMMMEIAFEAGAVIIMILLSGDKISAVIRKKSISDLNLIESLKVEYAYKIVNDKLEKVDASQIQIGEIIIVPKGAKVPLDGIIYKGSSQFDQSILTGESLPVIKHLNETVIAGSLNLSDAVQIKVTKTCQNTGIFSLKNNFYINHNWLYSS